MEKLFKTETMCLNRKIATLFENILKSVKNNNWIVVFVGEKKKLQNSLDELIATIGCTFSKFRVACMAE